MVRMASFGLCVAFALFMAACGDDSSSDSIVSPNDELSSEADSAGISSSSKKSSSSVKKESSSSKKVSSSSKGSSSSNKKDSSSSEKVSSNGDDDSSSSEEVSSSGKAESSSVKENSSSSAESKSSSSVASSSSAKIEVSSSSMTKQDSIRAELGTCDSSIVDSVGKFGDLYYICKANKWNVATHLDYNTYRWPAGEDGEARKGSVDTSYCYVFDKDLGNTWRDGDPTECRLGLGGCTLSQKDSLKKGSTGWWYKCEGHQIWITADVLDTALGVACTEGNSGKLVKTDSASYICRNKHWTTPTRQEIDTYGQECDEVGKTLTETESGDEYYCSENGWQRVTLSSWNYPAEIRRRFVFGA